MPPDQTEDVRDYVEKGLQEKAIRLGAPEDIATVSDADACRASRRTSSWPA